MRAISLSVVGLTTLMFTGCMETPSLETATGGVTVGQVVERVKCELAYAFSDRINQEKFLWMKNWTIKADLTLQGYMSAALTPGIGYTKNLHNAYNRDAGPTTLNGSTIAALPQVFTIGASANVGEQAYRTEVISFSISLTELQEWLKKGEAGDPQFFNHCFPAPGTGMEGYLGLGEWVNSALEPVADGQLQAGYHPPPGAAVSSKTPSSGPSGGRATFNMLEKNTIDLLEKELQRFPLDENQRKDLLNFGRDPSKAQELHQHLENIPNLEQSQKKELEGIVKQQQLQLEDVLEQKSQCNDAKNRATQINNWRDDIIEYGNLLEQSQFEIETAKESKKRLCESVGSFEPVLMTGHNKRKYIARWSFFFDVVQDKINKVDNQLAEAGSSLRRDDPKFIYISDLSKKQNPTPEECKKAEGYYTKLIKETGISAMFSGASDSRGQQQENQPPNGSSSGSDPSRLPGVTSGGSKVSKAITEILADLQNARSALPDPPVDALTHSVQFIVNYNAGISPNWSLAAWKGPIAGGLGSGGGGSGGGGSGGGGGGGGGSLASAGGQRQHTLNIAVGSPDKPDATRLLNNLNVQQAFH